jgi:putative transposase
MRQHRFSEEQMGAILSEPDLGAVVEAERNRNVSAQTIYIWRRKFGVLDADDVKRLRELESESTRLKRMLAEHEMAIDTRKEINRRKSLARRCVERRWPRQLSGVVRSDARAS